MKLVPLLTMALCSSTRLAVAFSQIRRSNSRGATNSRVFSAGTDATGNADAHDTASAVPPGLMHHTPKEERYQKAREKRRTFIGMAKAVDRGNVNITAYNPGFPSFQARSGLPDRSRLFTVLGIESSCDDTGAAIVRSDGLILGEALASQQEIHEEWGGIVPSLARDAHVANIDSVVEEALRNANMCLEDIDAIGVTVGPGLEICLRVGCNKARELAALYNKPFVGIHHLEAHILMARIGSGVTLPETPETHASERAMDFPFLALLISGGHCQLMKCHGIGNYTIIGGTVDDSLGEFSYFDSCVTGINACTSNLNSLQVKPLTRLPACWAFQSVAEVAPPLNS
jgi:tRNA N6-adenosine threonylcarbamoyltransferase